MLRQVTSERCLIKPSLGNEQANRWRQYLDRPEELLTRSSPVRPGGRGHADDPIPVPNSSLSTGVTNTVAPPQEPHESHVILLFSCYSFGITLDDDNIFKIK